ncbi:hypothetical protein [Actinophytocola sp.]|uniref:hypothetical protein n=1 Tax=Actinophytocola sp. TaxID=1872138 RepID=UPI003D6B4B3E
MAKGKGAGTVLLAGVLALAVASAGEDSGPAPDSGSSQAVANTFAARIAASQEAARRGDIAAAAQQLGMTAGPRARRHNVNCAAFATGQVRQYLLRTPCRSMDRLLFTIRDARGGTIAVAVAWVDFRTGAEAREFRRIDDAPGTGRIKPLPGSVAGIPNVALSGRHHRSRQVGTTAVSADAEPVVSGQQTDTLLDGVAGVAVLLPHLYGQAGK